MTEAEKFFLINDNLWINLCLINFALFCSLIITLEIKHSSNVSDFCSYVIFQQSVSITMRFYYWKNLRCCRMADFKINSVCRLKFWLATKLKTSYFFQASLIFAALINFILTKKTLHRRVTRNFLGQGSFLGIRALR